MWRWTDTKISEIAPKCDEDEKKQVEFEGVYDYCFGPASTTDQVYEKLGKPIIESVMNGFNGTLFAYGQTSSGKTFSMMGDEEHPGIIPQAANQCVLFGLRLSLYFPLPSSPLSTLVSSVLCSTT